MSIGERLNDLRVRNKRTLKEQSKIFGVSLNTVYRWEHNLTVPRKTSLVKIAAFYEVPYEWFVHGNKSDDHQEQNIHIYPENGAERQLLKMYRELPENSKYKILGYIERIYIEDINNAKYKQ